MSALLEGIRANNFVVVGRAGIDLYTDPGVATEDAETVTVGLGGSSANIAAGICKLGGQASLVTRVSDDSIGSYCIQQLKRYGVGTEYVTPVGGEYRNSLAFYESRVEGHRNVIYRNGAADFQMDADNVAAVDYGKFGALITAGTVFAAEPSRSATFDAFDRAKAAGLPIIFDVDYRPYSWPSPQVAEEVLSRAAAASDMIVGNDEEFGFMAGGIEKGLEKAKALAASTASIVVYKMGEKGAITFADGAEIHTGIWPVDANGREGCDYLCRWRRNTYRYLACGCAKTHRGRRQLYGRHGDGTGRGPRPPRCDPARLCLRIRDRFAPRLRPCDGRYCDLDEIYGRTRWPDRRMRGLDNAHPTI